MAKKSTDITKTGALTYRDLQEMNAINPSTNVTMEDLATFMQENGILGSRQTTEKVYAENAQLEDIPVRSSFMGQRTRLDNLDYLGNSFFDPDIVVGEQDWDNLSDVRAENQPWYSKLVNGVAKAGVLAVTTALETAGLLYGAGHSMLETAGVIDDDGKSWLQDLWDNPITNTLQSLNEASEEFMPNYYTRDEIENPFHNIFTANFLGDKLLKNLGFMVGAFYGGLPASTLIGKAGTTMVKSARAASLAERAGMARRVGELTAQYGDDIVGLNKALKAEHLTEAERGKRILEGFDKIRDIAQGTRATTQTIGALGSAINEGVIEAINNSKDWARSAIQEENARYLSELEEELNNIEILGGTNADKIEARMRLAEKHEAQLAEIEKQKASMGNADLLLNIPILMASNMYQLGKLYTRGFDSTRRQMGSIFNGHSLSGSLSKGTLKTDKTWKGALGTALLKSNTEGLEEYLQRAASDGAGNAVNESLKRFFNAGQSEEAKTNVDDYIAGFGKAIADNLGNPSAWEEYMIGAVSSMLGMPVFGSQTKNAYMKLGPVGFAGGVVGNYKDYTKARDGEHKVAKYLNGRVKDPKFKALYDNLKKQNDYDKWLQEELEKGDKSKYKDLELEKFYTDLNAAASSGHLEEFKQLVGYNTEYSDEELEDIVKQTTKEITPEQQRKADEDRKSYLEGAISTAIDNDEDALVEDYTKELEEVDKRLEEDKYQTKLEGPFIDRNGQMNVTDPDKMRRILERNKQNLLQGIDEYLKIRNDIDIETDGRLDDDQIELFTQMKGKILNYDKRSAEMADDLISNLGDVQAKQEKWQEGIKKELEIAQKEYNDAKAHLEAVKKGKHNEEHKNKIEKEVLAAEKKLNKAKAADRSVGNGIKLLQMLLEEKSTTAEERASEAGGYGDGLFGRTKARFAIGTQRKINSDEAQAILAHPLNALTLIKMINSKTSGLDAQTQERLSQEVVDLSSLANQKMAYNNKVREIMGDPQKINEAYQQIQDQISQKEKDNKSDELSLNIKNANSMVELDRIMREAYNFNPEIAKTALDKAKQTADEDTKKFIADYEKAINFYGDVARQAQKLPQEISAGIIGTAESEWENALQEGIDVYDKLIDGMHEAAEELDKNGMLNAKETAAGIRQILSDLNAARTSLATNKTTKKPVNKRKGNADNEANSEEENNAFALLQNQLKARKEGKTEEEAPSTDTRDSLQEAVEQEVRDSKKKDDSYKIDNLNKLSKELKDRIQKYNEENPGSEFMVDFEQLLQKLVDEEIAEDKTNLREADLKDDGTDLGDDNSDSEKAEDMHNNLRVTFKSDYPTEFEIDDDNNDKYDYRVHYDPKTEQLKAVQKLLQDLKAYHFVDKNYLGYVARALEAKGENVTIHLLRSTDDTINSDKTNPITFLAIKFDDAAENAIRKYGFGGSRKANLSDEIHPVIINGEKYHIVGVMTLNGQVAPEVSQAFASLQGELNKELNPQIEEAKDNGQPFVVSKLTTEIDTINTGRLDKRNTEDDDREKVSLYDFVATQQGDSTRSVSSEWSNGMDFYFGTIVNGSLNSIEDNEIRSHWEEPNQKLMGKNNGAVVMFVPKADGNFYPVRVTRRTVSEWLKKTADGVNTGEKLLASLLNGEASNEYLGNIINYLKDIYNEESTISTKMKAKKMLQKYFIFGSESPIHFNNGEITLQFEDREYELPVDSFEEFATAFFNILAEENIKFSLPAESIEKINGRDVIKSGVMEIGLRGFYNFNANFTIRAIDATGTDITSQVEPSNDEHFTGNDNIRATEMQLDLGDGMQTYILQGDGTVTLNGQSVSTDKQNIVTLVKQAEQGELPLLISEQLDTRYDKSPNVRRFIADGITKFNGVYIIHATEDWVYDSRKGNHEERLYRLSSDKGVALMKELNQAITDFAQQNIAKIKELKNEGGPEISNVKDKLKQSQASISVTSTTSSIISGEASAKMFVGKTLDDMNAKNGGLEEILATYKKSPVVKKVFAALQGAENAGIPIDEDKVSSSIIAIMNANLEEKNSLLQDLLNEINGCNK